MARCETTSLNSALVLFSGGQDSTACLAWALEKYTHVETIGFDFGQRHRVELTQRKRVLQRISERFPDWHARLGADHTFTLNALPKISETALTRDVAIEISETGLPTTFVPGRNLLFFTYAAALGYRRNITTLVGGMCETDYSGYPDCRNDTLKALETTLSLGLAKDVTLETPLMYLDKAATWGLIDTLGGNALLDIVIEDTHTCYLGERSERHVWGYGCGTCPACELRANGYARWRQNQTTSALPTQTEPADP